MAITNHERAGKALEQLNAALRPLLEGGESETAALNAVQSCFNE